MDIKAEDREFILGQFRLLPEYREMLADCMVEATEMSDGLPGNCAGEAIRSPGSAGAASAEDVAISRADRQTEIMRTIRRCECVTDILMGAIYSAAERAVPSRRKQRVRDLTNNLVYGMSSDRIMCPKPTLHKYRNLAVEIACENIDTLRELAR